MKKFITIALAVAVLFSFAACQQSMPTYKNVSYVTIEQTEDVIQGFETLAGSKFAVTAYYTDGTSSEVNVPVTISFENSSYVASATVSTSEKTYSVSAPVKAYHVTGINLATSAFTIEQDAAKMQEAFNEVIADIESGDNEVALEYQNGEYTPSAEELALLDFDQTVFGLVLENGNVTFDIWDEVGKTESVGKTYGVVVGNATSYVTTNVEVTIAEVSATFDWNELVSISIEQNSTIWYGDTPSAYAFTVTGTDVNGLTGSITADSITFTQNGSSISGALNNLNDVTVYATTEGADGQTLYASTTFKAQDHIDAIEVTVAENYTVADYETIDTSKLTVMGRYASAGGTGSYTVVINDYMLSDTLITSTNRSNLTAWTTENTKNNVQISDSFSVNAPV